VFFLSVLVFVFGLFLDLSRGFLVVSLIFGFWFSRSEIVTYLNFNFNYIFLGHLKISFLFSVVGFLTIFVFGIIFLCLESLLILIPLISCLFFFCFWDNIFFIFFSM